MKVFIGKRFSCSLNYQDEYICSLLAEKFEITNEVEEADILVFPSSCACTENTINNVFYYIYSCLEKRNQLLKFI